MKFIIGDVIKRNEYPKNYTKVITKVDSYLYSFYYFHSYDPSHECIEYRNIIESNHELAIDYILEKEFNKDLNDLIKGDL